MQGKSEQCRQEKPLTQEVALAKTNAGYVRRHTSAQRAAVEIITGSENPKEIWVPGDSLTELAVTSARAIAAKPGTHPLLNSTAPEAFREAMSLYLRYQSALRIFQSAR
jgi:hypothetical protein